MASALRCFELYVAIKMHFDSEVPYDYFRYKGSISLSESSLRSRNDRKFFAAVAKEYKETSRLVQYFAVNFFENPRHWIGDEERGAKNFLKFRSRFESFTYLFRNELDLLRDAESGSSGSSYPAPILCFLQGEISPETLLMLDSFTDILTKCDAQIQEKHLWPDIHFRLRAYAPFVKKFFPHREKYQEIVRDIFPLNRSL